MADLRRVFLSMVGLSLVSGLVPNLLTSTLGQVFTPTAMSVSTFLQPPLAVVIAWMIGLQYLPHWPVWLAMALLLASQTVLRDAALQSTAVAFDDRSADSRDQPARLDLHTPVLV